MRVLVAYASVHGSTAEVAHFIGNILSLYDLQVSVLAADAVPDPDNYDVFVLGSAIHAGMWLREMIQLAERLTPLASDRRFYLWVNCVRILEDDGRAHVETHYLHKPMLERLGVTNPQIFAGKLNIKEINWEERWTLAARYDGAKMPGTMNHDYRDWQAIATWAHQIAKDLSAVPKVVAPE
jgi:menaquinone-dependent protoporphyrinogen oxidase